jgi:hypothetical protein
MHQRIYLSSRQYCLIYQSFALLVIACVQGLVPLIAVREIDRDHLVNNVKTQE